MDWLHITLSVFLFIATASAFRQKRENARLVRETSSWVQSVTKHSDWQRKNWSHMRDAVTHHRDSITADAWSDRDFRLYAEVFPKIGRPVPKSRTPDKQWDWVQHDKNLRIIQEAEQRRKDADRC